MGSSIEHGAMAKHFEGLVDPRVERARILRTVARCRPNTRETSRILIPSTITARRTRRYTSTWYIHPTTHKHDFEPMDGRGRYIFQPPQCQVVNPSRWSTLAPPFTNHSANCGCEPCRTVCEVVARRLLASNSSAPFE